MNQPNYRPLLTEGTKLLEFAGTELNRAEEDAVTYFACHNLRKAATLFLNSFLLANGEPGGDLPLDILLVKSAAIDARFAQFNLKPIQCRGETIGENDCFCTDPSKVRDCLSLVRQLGQMVAAEIPPY